MYKEVIKAAKDSIKDVDVKKGEVVTAFATYKSKDRDGDIANKGMFAKSWKEFKDVRVFKNHNKETGPGVIQDVSKDLWDDDNNAFAKVKMGRHTEGQDTLLQIEDGIIKDSSYLFVPQKGKSLGNDNYSYTEVFHKEVSFLTHWGAHPESKIRSVGKSAGDFTLSSEVIKELTNDEVNNLKNFISSFTGNMQDLVNLAATLQPGSDLYTWIHDVISTVNGSIQSFKYRIQWYGPRQKSENDELLTRLARLKSFCRNTTASDECIQNVLKEADYIETLLSDQADGTQSSPISTLEQQKGANDGKLQELQLLNLSMLLDR